MNSSSLDALRRLARNGPRPGRPGSGKRPSLAATIGSIVLLVALALAAQQGWLPAGTGPAKSGSPTATAPASSAGATTNAKTSTQAASDTGAVTVAQLFREQRSDTFVETRGRVERLLDDDRETADGSDMHQRFLVRTDDGVTVLIAHNITVGARVPAKVGDRVSLRGEYEWSDRGGTIHFTHKPKFSTRDREQRGWIEHDGRRYE